jgi:sulfur carrier protein
MNVSVNGETMTLAEATTVAALIESLGLAGRRVAVEVNGSIVPRSEHATHALRPSDRVEVVNAIGGG